MEDNWIEQSGFVKMNPSDVALFKYLLKARGDANGMTCVQSKGRRRSRRKRGEIGVQCGFSPECDASMSHTTVLVEGMIIYPAASCFTNFTCVEGISKYLLFLVLKHSVSMKVDTGMEHRGRAVLPRRRRIQRM